MDEEEKKLEILMEMEKSVLGATKLARSYDFAYDVRGAVVYVMKLYRDFYGKDHKSAKNFGL